MQRVWLASCVIAAGCSGTIDTSPWLRVEPATIDLTVDLALPAPAAALQVLLVHDDGSVDDVTASATFVLAGAPLGQIAGASLVSDGLTGGAATIAVGYGDLATSLAATAHVYSRRVVDGTPAGAAAAFAAASPTPFDAHVDPQDGTVIPPDLGRMIVSFAANDLDDTHQLAVTAPYLDLAVVAPGVAGPRELDLSTSEVGAITHTARGGAIELAVASLQSSAPASSRVTTVGLEIADLDASSLLLGGIAAVGGVTDADRPGLWRYDMQAGSAAELATPAGTCFGCHLAVSADGARIGALSNTTASPFINGVILDAHTGAVLAQSDPTSASPWATAAFDPSGALLGAWQGALSLHDGTTGAMIGSIATADSVAAPTISPDGSALVYVSLDAGGSSEPVGNVLRMRAWNAAQLAVGPPIDLVRDGNGVVLPDFSSDGRWVAFGHSSMLPNQSGDVPASSSAVRVDGSGTMVMLTTDPLDQLAHWASPIAAARVGNREAEPMVWVAINSTRPVGGNATSPPQLWLEAFYPDRGVVAPAFHLPGQPAALQVLHGPLALP